MRHDSASILELDGKEVSVFTPSKPREKWQRKRTHVKLRVRVLWVPGPQACCPGEPSGETHVTDAVTESREACRLYPRSVGRKPMPRV